MFTMLYPTSNYFLPQFTKHDSWLLHIPPGLAWVCTQVYSYPFNPLGWVFYIKKPRVLLKVGFLMKLFIILYDNCYFTFEVASG